MRTQAPRTVGFAARRPNPVFGEPYRALRETLIAARKASGLSQRGLAAHLGKSASHVTMIERGQRRVDVLDLCLMARAFDVAPSALIDSIAHALADGANDLERSP